MFPLASKQVVILLEQRVRVCNHVAEAAQILLTQHSFDHLENLINLPAAAERFFVRDLI